MNEALYEKKSFFSKLSDLAPPSAKTCFPGHGKGVQVGGRGRKEILNRSSKSLIHPYNKHLIDYLFCVKCIELSRLKLTELAEKTETWTHPSRGEWGIRDHSLVQKLRNRPGPSC